MRQFREKDSRELKKLTANQFMEVWSHYDKDGKWRLRCLLIKNCLLDVYARRYIILYM